MSVVHFGTHDCDVEEVIDDQRLMAPRVKLVNCNIGQNVELQPKAGTASDRVFALATQALLQNKRLYFTFDFDEHLVASGGKYQLVGFYSSRIKK